MADTIGRWECPDCGDFRFKVGDYVNVIECQGCGQKFELGLSMITWYDEEEPGTTGDRMWPTPSRWGTLH